MLAKFEKRDYEGSEKVWVGKYKKSEDVRISMKITQFRAGALAEVHQRRGMYLLRQRKGALYRRR